MPRAAKPFMASTFPRHVPVRIRPLAAPDRFPSVDPVFSYPYANILSSGVGNVKRKNEFGLHAPLFNRARRLRRGGFDPVRQLARDAEEPLHPPETQRGGAATKRHLKTPTYAEGFGEARQRPQNALRGSDHDGAECTARMRTPQGEERQWHSGRSRNANNLR